MPPKSTGRPQRSAAAKKLDISQGKGGRSAAGAKGKTTTAVSHRDARASHCSALAGAALHSATSELTTEGAPRHSAASEGAPTHSAASERTPTTHSAASQRAPRTHSAASEPATTHSTASQGIFGENSGGKRK